MKYCKNCGAQIDDHAYICPKCGVKADNPNANDSGSFGWCVLGFCIPLVGLILYLVWKDSQPENAKKAGMGALISVIAGVIIYVILAIAGVSAGVLSYL